MTGTVRPPALVPANLVPERDLRIVRELASQLDDFHHEAIARGITDAAADAHACAQITDWTGLAESLGIAQGRGPIRE